MELIAKIKDWEKNKRSEKKTTNASTKLWLKEDKRIDRVKDTNEEIDKSWVIEILKKKLICIRENLKEKIVRIRIFIQRHWISKAKTYERR